jgi:3-hydroxyisobutyrate dehydrogenase
MADLPSVLFIGAGNMGRPMAMRLLEAGYPLAVADTSDAALAPFRERGIACATGGGRLPGDLVITMLPTDAHVREALLGAGGALERSRQVAIDMSSARPAGTLATAAQLAERGIAMLDAPVSGGVPRAKTGELITMVGGPADVVARYTPVLDAMCKTVQRVGEIGAGHTMKALNNFLSSALLVGARAGLDPKTMVEVWSKGTASSHAVQVKLPLAMLPRTFDYGFTIGLLAKDLHIAGEIARGFDLPMPMLASAENQWELAKHELGAQADYTAVLLLLEKWGGFSVPKAD